MPSKLKPGTPSMFAGSRMPCQWMDVSWPWIEPAGSALDTRRLTVVPSRQRNSGAGIEPLTGIAGRVTPVKLAGVTPMVRSNTVPDSTLGRPVTCPDPHDLGHSPYQALGTSVDTHFPKRPPDGSRSPPT